MSETPNKLHRYPGVRPFSKEEANIFFGRANEAKKLYNLIMLDKVVVLFAKSGRGKSSLINAALTPLFEGNNDSYIPVEVRLGNVQGDESTPLEKLMMKLKDAVPLPDDNFLIDKLIDDSASANQENKYQYHYQLWPYLKKLQISQHKKVLLIFDQFEEFFRHSPRQQEEFRWELSELVYTQVPQFIREKIDTLNYEEYSQFSALIDVKILFSIRSDRLSEMHSMNDALPNILQNRFEISSLDINQASDAIQLPAMIEDSRFITHPFKYDTDALNTILSELSKKEDYNSENIETFHLQIICQACEAKIEEKLKNNEVDKEINTSDLPGFADLYGDYYKRQIEKLPPNLQKVAESILEEELIYGSRETGGYRRLSVDKNILLDTLATKKAPKEILDMLEDIFLIRREPNTVGGYSYEISHDTILEPIIQNRDKKEIDTFYKFKNTSFMLGICRGSQILTMLSGGKLIQHVTGHNNTTDSIYYQGKVLNIPSDHHQMMYPFNLDKSKYSILGHSLHFKSDTYLNGENENIELPENFLEPEIVFYNDFNSLCIQSHPEWISDSSDPSFRYIMNLVISKVLKEN